jgi:hypothetical protein
MSDLKSEVSRPKPKPWFQFSLRALFGVVALIALSSAVVLLCGWDLLAAWVAIIGPWIVATYLDRRFSLRFSYWQALLIIAALMVAGVLLALLFPAIS